MSLLAGGISSRDPLASPPLPPSRGLQPEGLKIGPDPTGSGNDSWEKDSCPTAAQAAIEIQIPETALAKVVKIRRQRRGRHVDTDLPDDGYYWRKYGQKAISSSTSVRGYYWCARKIEKCPARKWVDRDVRGVNPTVVMYHERHNHLPAFKVGQEPHHNIKSLVIPSSPPPPYRLYIPASPAPIQDDLVVDSNDLSCSLRAPLPLPQRKGRHSTKFQQMELPPSPDYGCFSTTLLPQIPIWDQSMHSKLDSSSLAFAGGLSCVSQGSPAPLPVGSLVGEPTTTVRQDGGEMTNKEMGEWQANFGMQSPEKDLDIGDENPCIWSCYKEPKAARLDVGENNELQQRNTLTEYQRQQLDLQYMEDQPTIADEVCKLEPQTVRGTGVLEAATANKAQCMAFNSSYLFSQHSLAPAGSSSPPRLVLPRRVAEASEMTRSAQQTLDVPVLPSLLSLSEMSSQMEHPWALSAFAPPPSDTQQMLFTQHVGLEIDHAQQDSFYSLLPPDACSPGSVTSTAMTSLPDWGALQPHLVPADNWLDPLLFLGGRNSMSVTDFYTDDSPYPIVSDVHCNS